LNPFELAKLNNLTEILPFTEIYYIAISYGLHRWLFMQIFTEILNQAQN